MFLVTATYVGPDLSKADQWLNRASEVRAYGRQLIPPGRGASMGRLIFDWRIETWDDAIWLRKVCSVMPGVESRFREW